MPLIIHKLDASPPARAALMVAEILKLNYEPKEVNVTTGDNRTPEYLEKNPLHTIPLLEDGDFILADSHAIITYLVSKYGAEKRAELYPNDLSLKATIDQRLYFDATILFGAIRAVANAILRFNAPEPTPQQIADINTAYEFMEKYLEKTKYVACNHFTVADVSCVASISSLDVLVPLDAKYEKVNAWWNALKDEEWYKKINVSGVAQLGAYLKFSMEKNSKKA